MKRLLIIIALAAALAGLAACGQAGTGTGTAPQVITAEKAKEMMDAGGVTVVDVRTKEEYDAGHVAGALLIPYDVMAEQAPSQLPDKQATILVYCRTGRRATTAASTLADLGYSHVYNFGGVTTWPYGLVTD